MLKFVILDKKLWTGMEKGIHISRWQALGLVLLASSLITVYVWNVIRIDELLQETSKMQKEYLKRTGQNDVLKAKLNKMMSPERITKIARDELGMVRATTPPEIIR